MQKQSCFIHIWKIVWTLATLWTAPLAFATPTVSSVTANANSISRYDVYEVSMTANSAGYTDPWDDINITAVFTSPTNKTFTVHGFYYDTNTWKLRFAPNETGTWTYALSFDDGTGPLSLTTTGGNSFTCVASTNTGFLRIHPVNNQRFITEGNNNTFYAIGFDKTTSTGVSGA